MNWITRIAVIAALLGSAFQLGVFFESSQQTKRDLQTAQKAQTQQAKLVVEETQKSQTASQQINTEVIQAEKQEMAVKQKAILRLQKELQEKNDELQKQRCEAAGPNPSNPHLDTSYRLSLGLVRLLDSQRLGLPAPDSAAGGDAESSAPSNIGIQELVEDSTELTRMYRELAIRHDALVDYIANKQKEQANANP